MSVSCSCLRAIPTRFSLAIAVMMATAWWVVARAQGAEAPPQPTPTQVVDQFQKNDGVFPGYRRNHAKGVCVAGYFTSSGKAAPYSVAQVFALGQRTPVMGRLSIPGTNPYAWDDSTPIRGMALVFTQADGQQWRSAMNAVPAFPVATPAADFAFMKLQQPDPATGEPDPKKLAAFFASHPAANRFREWVATTPPSASFATRRYNSLDAFELVDARGRKRAVRWSMLPTVRANPREVVPVDDPGFLAQDLRRRLSRGPIEWKLAITFANAGDPVDDASRAWTGRHQVIDAGTLVIDAMQPQATGPCRDTNFDPTVLPAGIEPSGDPLLKFRHEVYAVSHHREVDPLSHTQGSVPASATTGG
ncbi:MAG: catalase family peroxidase [Rhodanobacteraceae bacterium]|nr:MAG: catalase family peroxidase [Rhodanobacteraceae bacterium]